MVQHFFFLCKIYKKRYVKTSLCILIKMDITVNIIRNDTYLISGNIAKYS